MGSQEEGGGGAAAEVIYLHGILEVTVFEAEHLHNAIHGRIMEVNFESTNRNRALFKSQKLSSAQLFVFCSV
jgi:hypothetical protein